MLVLALGVLALLSPLLAGRWSARLLLHRWRWPLLLWATFALQTFAIVVTLPGVLAEVLHVGTYVAGIVFLWANRSIPGVPVVAAGAALNGITIALNGGVLPASPAAVRAAGLDTGEGFVNSAVLADPVLPWLGDVFAWPAPLPLANTFSVGDVLIVLGVVIAAWTGTCRLGRSPAATEPETVRAGAGTRPAG